jgi:CDP-glycerol glycerophosphotransferase
MLLFSDIVISDYSGAYVDFILLNRPVIHFIYDYEEYQEYDSGLYYELDDFSAGVVTRTFRETVVELDRILKGFDKYGEKRRTFKKNFLEFESGTACKNIAEAILLKKKVIHE